MSTVQIRVEGSEVGTITVTETFDQANSDRFMAWLVAAYGVEPATESQEARQRTPTEMVAACWASIRAGIFGNIERHEAELAATAAREAIEPMASTTEVAAE